MERWESLVWTATKLHNEGISLVPLDDAGNPTLDWTQCFQSNVSRIELSQILAELNSGAAGLAIALGSSLNGDLWVRSFSSQSAYLNSVMLMGSQQISRTQGAFPLAACILENGTYNVLFMIDDNDLWQLSGFKEVGPGKYELEDGTIRGKRNLIRIPPSAGTKWIQEPKINALNPNRTNLFYYPLMEVGLIPKPF